MATCTKCSAEQPQTIFCENCGKKLESGAAFCDDCGTQVGVEAKLQSKKEPDNKAVEKQREAEKQLEAEKKRQEEANQIKASGAATQQQQAAQQQPLPQTNANRDAPQQQQAKKKPSGIFLKIAAVAAILGIAFLVWSIWLAPSDNNNFLQNTTWVDSRGFTIVFEAHSTWRFYLVAPDLTFNQGSYTLSGNIINVTYSDGETSVWTLQADTITTGTGNIYTKGTKLAEDFWN